MILQCATIVHAVMYHLLVHWCDCSLKPNKKHKKTQNRYVRNILGVVEDEIAKIVDADLEHWKERLEKILNRVKSIMHSVLSKGVLQQRPCFTEFILRVIPYEVREVEVVTDAGDGSDDKKTKYDDDCFCCIECTCSLFTCGLSWQRLVYA